MPNPFLLFFQETLSEGACINCYSEPHPNHLFTPAGWFSLRRNFQWFMFSFECYSMSAIIFMQGKLMQRPVKLGGEDGIDVKEVIEIGILVLPKGTVSVLTIIFMALAYTLAIISLAQTWSDNPKEIGLFRFCGGMMGQAVGELFTMPCMAAVLRIMQCENGHWEIDMVNSICWDSEHIMYCTLAVYTVLLMLPLSIFFASCKNR